MENNAATGVSAIVSFSSANPTRPHRAPSFQVDLIMFVASPTNWYIHLYKSSPYTYLHRPVLLNRHILCNWIVPKF